MEIRALCEGDDRSQFQSGDPDLDRFFRKFAGQNQFRHYVGVTYVAVEDRRILGFATSAPGHVEIEDLPPPVRKKLPRHPLPVLRLARLSVGESARGQCLGTQLLRFVLKLAVRMANDYGCVGVVVDAKRDSKASARDRSPLAQPLEQLSFGRDDLAECCVRRPPFFIRATGCDGGEAGAEQRPRRRGAIHQLHHSLGDQLGHHCTSVSQEPRIEDAEVGAPGTVLLDRVRRVRRQPTSIRALPPCGQCIVPTAQGRETRADLG